MLEQPKETPLFSIVLPCYNPIKGWEQTVVDSLKRIEAAVKGPVHLVLVNDGSTQHVNNSSFDFITKNHPATSLVSYSENRGKGYALRQGVKAVAHFPIIYTDIDFPYTLNSLLAVYTALCKGHDAVLGKRNNDYYKNTPFIRKVISKALRGVLKTFLRLPTDDTQCGIKGFNKTGANVFQSTEIDRFLFDLEFVKLVGKRQLNVTTIDVQLKPNIVFSKVNLTILAKESVNFIKVLFRK